MTKEELVTRLLSIDKQISTRSWITAGGDLGELIDELREEINREPSLPSNLDEAAENYYENDCPYDGEARVVNREYDVWFPSQAIEDAFKAGAEWMAGQGKSFDGIVRDDGFVDFDKYGSSMMIPSNTSCFNNSDKVIIQIRKEY